MKRPGLRALGRALGLAMLILAGAGLYWRYGAVNPFATLNVPADAQKMALVSQSSSSIAYRAEPQQWLSFALASGITQFKIISNANLGKIDAARAERQANPARRWNYALDIEVLDRNQKVLMQRTHHHRADIAEFIAADGQRYSTAFYLRQALTPLSGVIVNLDLSLMPGASRVRVRLAKKDADIDEVVLRAYQPERLSKERAALLWQRLNDRQREALARGSVYPHELLQESEKRNLLLHAWQAVGPQGAEGRDYHPRDLYVLLDRDGAAADDPAPPYGVLADAWNWGTLPLPEAGGRIRLEITPTRRPLPAGSKGKDHVILVRWFGKSLFERTKTRIPWAGQAITREIDFAGGLLEFEAPEEVAIKATRQMAGKEEDLTPPPQYLRVFTANERQPIRYSLAETGATSAIRLELRTISLAGQPLPAAAEYRFLDRAGQALKIGTIPLKLLPGHYEKRVADFSGAMLSDPEIVHFLAPENARQLVVSAAPGTPQDATPLLVSAHTRPPELAREIRMPEDLYDFNASGQPGEQGITPRIPAWFVVRPDDYESLVLNNQSQALIVQARPSEDRPEIRAGRFQWEDYRPQGNWLSRPIFAPREASVPERDAALPTTFSPLPMKREVKLDFPAFRGSTTLRPQLIWLGPSAPVTLQVRIDGKTQTLRLHGPYNAATLPLLASGTHRIRIDSTLGGSLYLNHVRPQPGAMVRHVAQFLAQPQTFDYERKSAVEETLTLRFFQPLAKGTRQNLRVRMEGPKLALMTPLQHWEFSERQASLRPDTRASSPVFDTRAERCDAGQAVYLPFKADAPLGRYRLSIIPPPGAAGYLSVSRLTPVISPERRIFIQSELPDAKP